MAKGIGLSAPGKGPRNMDRGTTARPGNVQPVGKAASVPKVGTDEHYRATSDMETLKSAEMIRQDAKRHGAARAVAAQHIQSLQHLVGDGTTPGKFNKSR